VVSSPTVTTAVPAPDPNHTYGPSFAGKAEIGGAVMNLSYTPTAANGAPVINNLHWIQALGGPGQTLYGAAVPSNFDTGSVAYGPQSKTTPFYDYDVVTGKPTGAAGTLANNGGWFLDRPQVPEFQRPPGAEYENNPVVSVQFQVVLAGDKITPADPMVPGSKIQNDVTLYGGYWWGFTYTAIDTPEPASLVIWLCLGGMSLLVYRRTRRGKSAN
jgi:hypothetical protein